MLANIVYLHPRSVYAFGSLSPCFSLALVGLQTSFWHYIFYFRRAISPALLSSGLSQKSGAGQSGTGLSQEIQGGAPGDREKILPPYVRYLFGNGQDPGHGRGGNEATL